MNRYKIHEPPLKMMHQPLEVGDMVLINPKSIADGRWNPIYYAYRGQIAGIDNEYFMVYWHIGDERTRQHWLPDELVRQ